MQTPDIDIRPGRPRLAAYAALLALALFQLGFAMHQAEHTVNELGETCAACSHFNDFVPVSEPADRLAAAPRADAVVPAPARVADDTPRYPTHARAPPFA